MMGRKGPSGTIRVKCEARPARSSGRSPPPAASARWRSRSLTAKRERAAELGNWVSFRATLFPILFGFLRIAPSSEIHEPTDLRLSGERLAVVPRFSEVSCPAAFLPHLEGVVPVATETLIGHYSAESREAGTSRVSPEALSLSFIAAVAAHFHFTNHKHHFPYIL